MIATGSRLNTQTSPGAYRSPAPNAATGERLAFLDGIRGLTALYVMAHHLWRAYTDTALPGLLGLCTNWLLYGHLGVDVFIVLSGFCLMLPVVRSRALKGGWRRFYKARTRRIIPPLYAAIVFSIALQMLHSPTPKLAILANFLLLQDVWQSQNTINAPLWSVALEWKIYLLFPGFVWLWLRRGPASVLQAAAAVSAVLFGVFEWLPTVWSQTHCCSWYVLLFALGMIAAECAVSPSPKFIALRCLLPALAAGAFLCLAAALYRWRITPEAGATLFDPHLPLIDATLGVFGALFFAVLGRKAIQKEKSVAANVLSWPPLVFVGSFGYSLYLIHADLIYAIKNRLVEHLSFRPAFVVIPVDMTAVVGIAYLFHLFFERPFMSKPAPVAERQTAASAVMNLAP